MEKHKFEIDSFYFYSVSSTLFRRYTQRAVTDWWRCVLHDYVMILNLAHAVILKKHNIIRNRTKTRIRRDFLAKRSKQKIEHFKLCFIATPPRLLLLLCQKGGGAGRCGNYTDKQHTCKRLPHSPFPLPRDGIYLLLRANPRVGCPEFSVFKR